MAATIVNGRNVVLYQYDSGTGLSTPFASATAADISIQSSMREVTNESSAFFREFKPDINSWEINCSGFIVLSTQYNYLTLANLITNRTQFQIKFVIDNGGIYGLSIFTGNVYIKSFQVSGGDDTLATYSVSLQGTGQYSTSGTTISPSGQVIVSGTIVQVFQVTAAGGETSIAFSGALGLTALYASRSGSSIQPLAYSGSPTAPNGAVWTASTYSLTLSTAAVTGELFLLLAQ
jgi:predicted secreted protein